jgi:diamine N-acetyltransferase
MPMRLINLSESVLACRYAGQSGTGTLGHNGDSCLGGVAAALAVVADFIANFGFGGAGASSSASAGWKAVKSSRAVVNDTRMSRRTNAARPSMTHPPASSSAEIGSWHHNAEAYDLPMIDYGLLDKTGRRVTLRAVDEENWRAVADIAPRDDQRSFVAALAARYLLLSMRENVWRSLAVYADDAVVGHIMWGLDEDGTHWLGGMLIDAAEQGKGLGRTVVRTITAWLAAQEACRVIRLSYHPENTAARRLYESLGFTPAGVLQDEEIVAELSAVTARHVTAG